MLNDEIQIRDVGMEMYYSLLQKEYAFIFVLLTA